MEIDIRVQRARATLVREHPFFGALAMRLAIRERSDIGTLATDGRFLYYNLSFLDRLSAAELLFCIAHEVLHCALSHMVRRGSRRWDLWQAATDYVVNLMLHKAGFPVPRWVKYFDPKYDGLSVETVYRLLLEQEQEQQSQQPQDEEGEDECKPDDGTSLTSPDRSASPEPGGGSQPPSADGEPSASSAGTSPPEGGGTAGEPSSSEGGGSSGSTSEAPPAPSYGDPGGCGEVLDAAPPHQEATQREIAEEWATFTRQAANVARRAGQGHVPGTVAEVIRDLDEARTDWRAELRQLIDPFSSTKDYTWRTPNRRYLAQGYFAPSLISDGLSHMGLFVDTSGSISREWLRSFGAEAQAALDDGALDKVTVVFADETIHKVVEYVRGEVMDWTCEGRGGTEFRPTFEWAERNLPDLTGVIYFTDLEVSDFGPEPPFPVIWAVHGSPHNRKKYMARVPWGRCVELRD